MPVRNTAQAVRCDARADVHFGVVVCAVVIGGSMVLATIAVMCAADMCTDVARMCRTG